MHTNKTRNNPKNLPAPCVGVTFLLPSTQQHVVGTTFGQMNSDGCSQLLSEEAFLRNAANLE